MALLQRTRVLANQRLDLPDYKNIESFVCADFSALHKNMWSNSNYVFSGFEATGSGTNTLSVAVANSSAIIGLDNGTVYIGAPSLSAIQTTNLTPNSVNYVEIFIDQDTGGQDSRVFWNSTAAGGAGGEFSQVVDTFSFQKAEFAINSSNFTGDADKLPIAEVTVDNAGNITTIVDARPMFFRLGKPNNPGFSFNWSNGRSAENPSSPSYDDPDKIINNVKTMFDALMDSVKEIKGTTYWYEAPFTSLTGTMQNHLLSVVSGKSITSKFTWTGTELLITDSSPTGFPNDDVVAYLRFLNSAANITLTRQDTNSTPITIDDGEVLWLELPSPLVDLTYSDEGTSQANYRISPRGAVPLEDTTFWLAFREGSRLYLRGRGELEAGESQQIGDETSQPLQQFLGFDPETATSVPYPTTPNSLIFANLFDSSSPLVEAISTNTENINGIGIALDENAYEEYQEVIPTLPSNPNELQGPILSGATLTLPVDSRDGSSTQEYVVGDGVLELYHDGAFLTRGVDWNEVGTAGSLSTDVTILRDLNVGEIITYRMASLGGFNVGSSGSGGDVTSATNIGGGEGSIFKQKVAGSLELRTIKAGAGISVITSGDQIIIATTGGAPTPYFRNYITGSPGTLINTGGTYNLGEDKLEVYRNGTLSLNSTVLGLDDERYQEATNTSIALEGTAPAVGSDVFTFVNQDTLPTYRTQITGQVTTTLTVPSYTQGNNSLRVFRNGVLMNTSGHGSTLEQYTETSPTSLTLAATPVGSDVFVVISGPVPSSREDVTGLTNAVITLSNSYVLGSEELLVYRNGVLIHESTTLGLAPDRYQETTTNSITLETTPVASERFTFIIK